MPGDPAAAAAAGPGADGARPPQRSYLAIALQFAAIYFIVQKMSSGGNESEVASGINNTDTPGVTMKAPRKDEQPSEFAKQLAAMKDMVAPEASQVLTPNGTVVKPSKALRNAWPLGARFSIALYTSNSPKTSITEAQAGEANAELWWSVKDLSYSLDDENKRNLTRDWSLPDSIRIANGSLYLHAYFMHESYSPRDPNDLGIITAHYPLVSWRWEKVAEEGRSLLGDPSNTPSERSLVGWVPWSRKTDEAGDDESDDIEKVDPDQNNAVDEGSCGAGRPDCQKPKPDEDLSTEKERGEKQTHRSVKLLAPELQLEFVPDRSSLKVSMLPPPITEFLAVTNDQNYYLPWASFSDFWLLRRDLVEINETVTDAKIAVHLNPVGMRKFLLMKQTDYMLTKQTQFGGQGEDEANTVKETILETNPWLLGLTVIVSLAHTVLEFLAFSSDIKHWRAVKSMEGVSVRSMFWKVGMEVVVFLYLLDNETSFMILAGSGVGTLIEVWKLGKAVRPKNFGGVKLWGVIPWFELEESESYAKSTTKEYDNTAMTYLAYILYPLVAGYSLYSLLFNRHKSWYSWVLSSLVGAVYMFGFIMMFPQIFINYKLKSVAHLPLKAFMYKALNTVIDDLFSFIIKMPLMHRLACFRDDIVFIAFLYQRWQYPVDKTRVNEYGQSFVEEPKKKKKIVRVKKLVVRRKTTDPTGSTETILSGTSTAGEDDATSSTGDKKTN